MTYQETLDWMFNKLPMYQNQGKTAYKKDLSNTLLLANYLNHPEAKFKSIHVAGTNGKGSTSHMLASILQEAGYRVGLYTSPHLKDFRERIKINGIEISEDFVVNFISTHKFFIQKNSLSFFEMTVGLAFNYFDKSKVDIAVIEVGLGGRLDSTNIIIPEVSVITNIGLDHTQFLGNTLELIAKEKGGIIKPSIPVVIGETQSETAPIFKAIAHDNGAEIIFADQKPLDKYRTDLLGDYQTKNIKTACQAIRSLDTSFNVSDDDIENGLINVTKNTGLLGRWQILQDDPKIICDTAHNAEGLRMTMKQLSKEKAIKLHIVFGIVADKELSTIIKYLPLEASFYYCQADIPRAMPVLELESKMSDYHFKGTAYFSVREALKAAKTNAKKGDVIYIGGSTFVVSEVL